MDRIEPDATGTWDVITLSGARYRLAIPADGRASIVRVPQDQPAAGNWPKSAPMRHDNEPIEVIAWGAWDQMNGLLPGVMVGDCMVLVLEPLGASGLATTRITTPVAMIRELDPPELSELNG
jgi:hypothetical protein